jgi:hypothetical protein
VEVILERADISGEYSKCDIVGCITNFLSVIEWGHLGEIVISKFYKSFSFNFENGTL